MNKQCIYAKYAELFSYAILRVSFEMPSSWLPIDFVLLFMHKNTHCIIGKN